MKSYNFYKNILVKAGYHENDEVEFINGVVSTVEFFDDKQHLVVLGVQPTDEYEQELMDMEEGTEYTPDFDRMEVYSALFYCSICNVRGFMDSSANGIILKDEDSAKSGLLEIIGGDEYQAYYPHKMDLFEKCLWIQSHIIEHEINILSAHLNNMKTVMSKFDAIMCQLDFYQYQTSLLDCTIENRENSNPFCTYKHRASELMFDFSTDCITGELLINGDLHSNVPEDFRQYIIDKYFKYYDEIDVYYMYLFDNDYNIDTAQFVLEAQRALYASEHRTSQNTPRILKELEAVDLDKLPVKDYSYLINGIKEEIQKIKNENA